MRRMIPILLAILTVGCQPGRQSPRLAPSGPTAAEIAAVFDGSGGRWVDLTHAFSERSVFWPTDTAGFELEELAYGPTEGGWFYSSYRYSGAEHGGTRLDAPIHFAAGRNTSDRIPLSRLIAPAVVVDVSDRAHADYLVSSDDLRRWEAEHGRIPDGAILLARTGWSSRYANRAAYLGTERVGPDAVAELHFPGFENVAGLEQLPAVGSFVVALPMKIEGGSGGPLRIVAYLPRA